MLLRLSLATALLLLSGCMGQEDEACQQAPCTAAPPPSPPPPPSEPAAEPMLVPNTPGVSGTIGGSGFGTVLFFAMDLEAGRVYRLNTSLEGYGYPRTAQLTVADDDWAHMQQWSTADHWIFEARTTRRYFAAVLPGHEATPYTVSLTEATRLLDGVPQQQLSGRLTSVEEPALYTFQAEQGHTYATGCTSHPGPRLEPVQLRDAAGTRTTDLWISEERVWSGFEATRSSRTAVYVRESLDHDFDCLFRDLGLDDAGDAPADARGVPLPFEGTLRWALPSDVDVVSFTAAQGRRLRVTCTPSEADSCELCMRDASGAPVGGECESSTWPRTTPLEVTIWRGGAHTLSLTPGNFAGFTRVGPYALRIEDLGP